ncbi:hypothetical protein HA052_17350 [Chromobacterium haemolyticum]|uniref:Thymidylate kinase n=1 Tax=Chromobacterium fluminis TaxID=3044269 RepID=A0ABX0LBP6_9NEIS|nr:hypothetical protein [Chromobacterium haemolyticum]NHR06957.1 hypothetical protein [Chromobacterium haemolyticum]
MLINILGGDGCGKTTQIRLLEAWVRNEFGISARSLAKRDIFDKEHFPECDFFGCNYEQLAHHFLPKMRDECRALWLIYMNAVLIKGQPAQAEEIVFLDGYWQKHFATEAALGVSRQWLKNVCLFFPEPELTILFDLDPRVIVARGHLHHPYESGCDYACSDASFIRHQDKVRACLLELASERGYPVLDVNRSEQEIFHELCLYILAAVSKDGVLAKAVNAGGQEAII